MRMDASFAPLQAPVITYRQIAAVRLLQLSSQELEVAIAREQVENPALEAECVACCPRCGGPLTALGQLCLTCATRPGTADRTRGDWDDLDGGATTMVDDDEDPIYRVAAAPIRAEGLLRLLRLALPSADAAIAEYLVASLDDHGYLAATIVAETARALHCSATRVERALAALQQLDPPGIGARGARECLLIQLARLRESGDAHPLAELLVREHLKPLAFRHFREVAHVLGLTPKKIELEWMFIRRALHPYPAHGYHPDIAAVAQTAAPVRPDVIIRRKGSAYSVEVSERQRYTLRVSDEYLRVRRQLATLHISAADREHVRAHIEQAQSFIAALRQRWETMQRVTEALIVAQREYLERGQGALKPLTRADVARTLGLHESTVSRATDGKFILLPDGRSVPFDDFFNGSLPVREALRDLVAGENPFRPLSDEQLKRLLTARGFEVARRTIAKYREEMAILPSRLRRQRPPRRQRVRKPMPLAAGARPA